MQYDTIEELMLELSLYPNKKLDILEDNAKRCRYGWFTVAKDGNCALFDENGDLDDLSKIKTLTEDMIPKYIEKINIPDGVTSIGIDAFYYCKNLISVTIPDSVTSIGDSAFYECTELTSMTIGTGVKSIEDWAFAWCNRLMSVTIPDSVTSIGEFIFQGCSNLKELIFKGKTIEEVKSMKNYPFGLEDVSIIRCEG